MAQVREGPCPASFVTVMPWPVSFADGLRPAPDCFVGEFNLRFYPQDRISGENRVLGRAVPCVQAFFFLRVGALSR